MLGNFIEGCILGKFGNGHCDNNCLYCLGNICHSTSGVCITCAAGYHRSGDVCVPCPPNCAGNTFDGSSGACPAGCKAGFSGTYCKCPVNCADQSCSTTGLCLNCNDGYYGPTCTQCPTGCSSNTCDKTSGICFGCKAEFSGKYCRCPLHCADQSCLTGQCSNCNDGYYGATCTPCPTGCSSNTCDKTSGICFSCKADFSGTYCRCPLHCADQSCLTGHCSNCNDGYYGATCTPCPTGCSSNTCDKTSGICLTGCKTGFSGTYCRCPLNCADQSCPPTGHCSTCSDGYYGQSCLACPTGCSTTTCNQTSGICLECEAAKHGETCDKTCPGNCSTNACYQVNGQCSGL
ncbi:multiple epidermal growth factor-like domains protein 10 [Argopecten irradians]|uniref:multiple epidermal growth factor-like domains protein 10 n=1 Tax=Argopecten irradians TaxID=31199 RepID=UPI0037211936